MSNFIVMRNILSISISCFRQGDIKRLIQDIDKYFDKLQTEWQTYYAPLFFDSGYTKLFTLNNNHLYKEWFCLKFFYIIACISFYMRMWIILKLNICSNFVHLQKYNELINEVCYSIIYNHLSKILISKSNFVIVNNYVISIFILVNLL